MRKFILIPILFLAFFSGCATTTTNPQPEVVRKSFYLNKPLVQFEMDNGYCYSREPLNGGGYINYWQSDKGNIIANLMDWDSYPYCKLALYTNKDNIITKIEILEDSIKCAYALK